MAGPYKGSFTEKSVTSALLLLGALFLLTVFPSFYGWLFVPAPAWSSLVWPFDLVLSAALGLASGWHFWRLQDDKYFHRWKAGRGEWSTRILAPLFVAVGVWCFLTITVPLTLSLIVRSEERIMVSEIAASSSARFRQPCVRWSGAFLFNQLCRVSKEEQIVFVERGSLVLSGIGSKYGVFFPMASTH